MGGKESVAQRGGEASVVGYNPITPIPTTSEITPPAVFRPPKPLPPVKFHKNHGQNVIVSRNYLEARRVKSFCTGIVFSNRTVRVEERVYVKFLEISSLWNFGSSFGFTSNDPSKVVTQDLPKYSSLLLTAREGYWINRLNPCYEIPNSILYYYVTKEGDLLYGIDGEDKGVSVTSVNVEAPLWAFFDIHGKAISVRLLDEEQMQQESSRPRVDEINIDTEILSGDQGHSSKSSTKEPESICFHKLHGMHCTLSKNRTVAKRKTNHIGHGYVFTSRPVSSGEIIAIEIQKVDLDKTGSLGFGMTNCKPDTLKSKDLPDDEFDLLDRPEYWIVRKDVAHACLIGDELFFRYLPSGDVQMSRNKHIFTTLMFVDTTQVVWAFFNLYGKTRKIQMKASARTLKTVSSLPDSNHLIPVDAFHSATSLTLVGNAKENTTPAEIDESLEMDKCVICFEEKINSVIYTCGHSCMCFACARDQWKNRGGICPMCRKKIRDVIRVYPS